MKKKIIKSATILIVCICIVAVVSILWVFRKTPESVGNSKPEIKTDVVSIINDYEKSESEANKKYLDKIILVTGTVESIKNTGEEISVTLKEQNSISGVICNFNKNSIDTSTFITGSVISVIGICNGYLMDVVLSKCVLSK
jgi:hypothetical protein